MKAINFGKIGRPARVAIAVVPALLYAAVFTMLLLMPKHKAIKAQMAEISAQQNDIANTQSMASRLNLLKDENARLRARLDELSEQLPEEKEVSQLLGQVSDAGTRAGLQILSWKPGPRKLHQSKIVYEVPVDVTLSGSYHRFGSFLGALTRLKRIVNISDIKMSAPKPSGNEARLSISFTALTFTAAESGGLTNTAAAGPNNAGKK
ncbi:MAG: type 4a pilus biogenesis protein PilO [Nitrospiraceae bacterium]|nr:type 4a pilus biogenesis protein PilO [Nitrospiraceae bacterium]